MLVVILTMTTFVLDIIKGIKAIASSMNAIVNGSIWCLLLPVVYDRPKVGCANRLDRVSLNGFLMEYNSATCCIIDVGRIKQRLNVSIRDRKIDCKKTINSCIVSRFNPKLLLILDISGKFA